MYQHIEYALGYTIHGVGDLPHNYEPDPRKHGGRLQHHGHRFSIVGGITKLEADIRNYKIWFNEYFINSHTEWVAAVAQGRYDLC